MDLKGTKTEQNLKAAFSGESEARNKYTYFASVAKKEGFEQLAEIFQKTADNEKEHAEIWFKCLGGWSSTENNLNSAAGGEHFEWSTMYSQFANEAKEEGFDAIADLFERVASVEKAHEERYVDYLNKVRNAEMFTSDSAQTKWICINCGYVVTAKEPPKICPTCSHPQGYFDHQRSRNNKPPAVPPVSPYHPGVLCRRRI